MLQSLKFTTVITNNCNYTIITVIDIITIIIIAVAFFSSLIDIELISTIINTIILFHVNGFGNIIISVI